MAEAIVVPRWAATSAWAPFARPGRYGAGDGEPGVVLTALADAALATVIVRPGMEARLEEIVRARYGFGLPTAGRMYGGAQGELIWSAPGQWLVMAAHPGALDDLAEALAGTAAVSDQSDGRALLRIEGANARDALAKGVTLDLHPAAFSAGCAASTSIAHMNVQFWQTDEAPTYVLGVPRSFAGSLWGWLSIAAEQYGYRAVGSNVI